MNPEVTVAGADYLDTFLKEINVFEKHSNILSTNFREI